jgi:tetratricopeptide (TPR) repeat protein
MSEAFKLRMDIMLNSRLHNFALAGLLTMLMLAGCAATELVNQWSSPAYTAPWFKRVMVIAVTRKASIRRNFEDEFVAQLKAAGVDAVPSYQYIPDEGQVEEPLLNKAVLAAGAFVAANAATLDYHAQLRAIAADTNHPAIARATALAQMDAVSNKAAIDALATALRDRSPLVRFGVLLSLANAPPDTRARLAAPLLADPLRAVRMEAVSVLAPVPTKQLSAEQRAAFERGSAEYITSQQYNADRADARLNLGIFYVSRGDASKAEAEVKAAIGLDRHFIPAYVNLADLYRAQNRDRPS